VTRFDEIEHASLTDVGIRRSHNQDSVAVQLARDGEQWQQRGHLFLVADGMGAHAVGEKASEQAAGLIPHMYGKYAAQGAPTALRKAFIEANASIHACGQANRDFQGMGTTSTALLLRPEGAWVGHVGDSRAYRVRDGLMEQLSYDHSLVWEYARIKRIDPTQVQDIPANVIHRCLGPEPLVQVDIEGPHPLRVGDVFVVCSDGLSGQLADQEIGSVASALPPSEACRLLVDLANIRGGPDNISVIVVRMGPMPDAAEGTAGLPAPGVNGAARRGGSRSWRDPAPWWLLALAAGNLLALLGCAMHRYEFPGALWVFLAGAPAALVGLGGLVHHYARERRHAREEVAVGPRVHRKAACPVDPALADRFARLLEALRQRVEERGWPTDWPAVEAHRQAMTAALERGDLAGGFRECCRALLPLTQAFNRVRQKEEKFPPLPEWTAGPAPPPV
jgi:protein phosphatase